MLSKIITGSILYNLVDDGIANVLGLETLRHGTNLCNNLSIRVSGCDPNHGGKTTGSTHGYIDDNTNNRVYVFKDSEFDKEMMRYKTPLYRLLYHASIKRICTKLHTYLSSYNFIQKHIIQNSIVSKIVATVSGIFSPTLRFRFSRIDSKRFANDPRYGNMAYVTTKKIEAWRLGILGSLITGINFDWYQRVRVNPGKVLTGVIQLIAACVLAAIASLYLLRSNPFTIVPLALGATLA